MSFTLNSPTFTGNVPLQHVYHDFGAGGANQSPELSWANPPEGTQSFLIFCHDPDAPGPGGWWHWCAFNIPATTSGLANNASMEEMPAGSIQLKNSYGSTGYGGCCPPPGDQAHAYHLVIYALDIARLDLDASVSPAMALFVADAHIIGKTGIVGYYAR